MKCQGCGMSLADNVTKCPYCGSAVSGGFGGYANNGYGAQQSMPTYGNSYGAQQSVPAYGNRYANNGYGAPNQAMGNPAMGQMRKSEGISIYDKNIDSVGIINTDCGAGTGFLIERDGYMVTNTHVIADDDYDACQRIFVTIAGETVPAEVVKMGDDEGGNGNGIDIALLKLSFVPRNAKCVKLGNSDKVQNGENVFCIGNSQGEGLCITRGIISDKCRWSQKRDGSAQRYIMSDVAINPGNSGGPLFNERGEVIGVIVAGAIANTAIAPDGSIIPIMSAGMKYIIPINDAMRFVNG